MELECGLSSEENVQSSLPPPPPPPAAPALEAALPAARVTCLPWEILPAGKEATTATWKALLEFLQNLSSHGCFTQCSLGGERRVLSLGSGGFLAVPVQLLSPGTFSAV